jgi:hypothetical protein
MFYSPSLFRAVPDSYACYARLSRQVIVKNLNIARAVDELDGLFAAADVVAPERYVARLPPRTEEPNFHVPEAFGVLQFE